MRLQELSFPSSRVETPGGVLTVRGLSTDDLTYLFDRHRDRLEALWSAFLGAGLPGSPGNSVRSNEGVAALLVRAPKVIADIIACAADDRESADVVLRWPAQVQIRVLTAIIQATLTDEDLDRFMEIVTQLVLDAALRATATIQASESGFSGIAVE